MKQLQIHLLRNFTYTLYEKFGKLKKVSGVTIIFFSKKKTLPLHVKTKNIKPRRFTP